MEAGVVTSALSHLCVHHCGLRMCTGLAVAHFGVAVMVMCYAAYVAMRQYSQAQGRLGDVTMTIGEVEVSRRGRLPHKSTRGHTRSSEDVALRLRPDHQYTNVFFRRAANHGRSQSPAE